MFEISITFSIAVLGMLNTSMTTLVFTIVQEFGQ